MSACLLHDTVVLCVVLGEALSPVVKCEVLLVVVVEPLLVLLPVSVAGVELLGVGAALLEALLHHLLTDISVSVSVFLLPNDIDSNACS